MPTVGSKTVGIRFNPDDLGKIEEVMEEGYTFNGAVHKMIESYGGAPSADKRLPHVDDDVMRDIEGMIACSGGRTFNDLMMVVRDLMNDGTIDVGSGFRIVSEPWVENFKDTCHDLCIPVDKTAESACKALRKGII